MYETIVHINLRIYPILYEYCEMIQDWKLIAKSWKS